MNKAINGLLDKLARFFHSDSAVGVALFSATFIAIALENSPFSDIYHSIQHFEINLEIGNFFLAHDLHYWVNECLMVLFFLMVGLEIKREMLTGQLASINYVILPAVAAMGGIIVPAGIFWFFNGGTQGIDGWAIPTATDIAFAVGLIALFGNKLPSNVKLFILTLAVIDDIAAIFIIAVFYSESINMIMLFYTFVCGAFMWWLNTINLRSLTPYMLIGALTWFFMLQTGIHPTLTGIIVAACIPLRVKQDPRLPHAFGMDLGETRLGYVSPAIKLEAGLHTSVSFIILPLFAFMNSGLNLAASIPDGSILVILSSLFSGVAGGTFWGLFLGKPLGILGGILLWKFITKNNLPSQIDLYNVMGIGFVCGIGYTMSILLSTIAYEGSNNFINNALFGILLGSFCAGLAAALIFMGWIKKQQHNSSPNNNTLAAGK